MWIVLFLRLASSSAHGPPDYSRCIHNTLNKCLLHFGDDEVVGNGELLYFGGDNLVIYLANTRGTVKAPVFGTLNSAM